MKNIYLLGATGSIGTQVLDVVRNLKDFKIKSISVGRNIDLTVKIIDEFKPEYVSVIDEENQIQLAQKYPDIEFGYGEESIVSAASYSDEDGLVVNAVVGMVGLLPTIAGIKKRRDILLANKETLVVAGEIITNLVKEYNVRLLPIDSEHSAIFQCIQGSNTKDVKRLIITASGGSFRDLSRLDLEKVTLAEALNHPNWSMGQKITIDSATMVNKGLEVIEAHYLFGVDYAFIDTVIHPESIIHSMVEFNDNSIIAQMSNPNMKIPIQYALTYPNKLHMDTEAINFSKLSKITFKEMDYLRFPMIKLAYEVGIKAGNLPTVYNMSNEVAVGLFLKGRISFLEIENIITEAVMNADYIKSASIKDIIKTAYKTKEMILSKYL